MSIRPLTLVLPLALTFGLAACDSRDYEAEIADLQTQLGDATSELEAARGENESLNTELEQLRTQAEQAGEAAVSVGEDAAQQVQTQLETALEKASQTAERLAALEREPDAPADKRTEAVGILRSDVQEIVASLEAAAGELGIELQAGPEPAAGPAQGEATGSAEEPAQAAPTDEQAAEPPQQQ
jgi:chromosome segregation ATPase